jgi:hypothetical protein
VTTDGGVGFTIELGPTLTEDEVARHAQAVVTVAAELLSG